MRSARSRALCLAGLLGSAISISAQQPVFRTAVDLIAVDAQVIGADGRPVTNLAATDFDVSLNGRRRRVVSAEVHSVSETSPPERLGAFVAAHGSTTPGRTFVIAIDASSFDVGTARAPAQAAQAFVSSLQPGDRIGLYVYPNGPRIAPGFDRVQVRQRLDSVLGNRVRFGGLYHLKPSEVVDITGSIGGANPAGLASRTRVARTATVAEIEANPVLGVQARECPDDPECANRIISEAHAMGLHLEGQAMRSLGGLNALLGSLVDLPGRKTVVLITAGVVVSDRPGGRPDVGDMSRAMGHAAAEANAVVYTVHIDTAFASSYSAGRRRSGEVDRDRDRSMSGDWLDRFSAAAGGARIHVPVGAGEFAFERVLRETSAYYLLGVEPSPEDRDGRARELKVTTKSRGDTVRSRQWVVVR